MRSIPGGQIRKTAEGRDLVLTRTFRADIDDVWASITESDRTARWFASWSGEPGAGNSIRYRLVFEEGAPESTMQIDVCDPPHHLAVSAVDNWGSWRLEARLTQDGDVTTLTFVHHLDDAVDVSSVGPGWEYYLDQLVASRAGDDLPNFDDYYPHQAEYYRELEPT